LKNWKAEMRESRQSVMNQDRIHEAHKSLNIRVNQGESRSIKPAQDESMGKNGWLMKGVGLTCRSASFKRRWKNSRRWAHEKGKPAGLPCPNKPANGPPRKHS
jgi:hypothetical protein